MYQLNIIVFPKLPIVQDGAIIFVFCFSFTSKILKKTKWHTYGKRRVIVIWNKSESNP